MREALRRDEKGDFVYSTIVWSDIKKSIKSTIAAAVALWVGFNSPWGSVKIVANDLKQADSRSSYYARRCIELNRAMAEVCKVKPSGYSIELPNRCKIEAIPVDPKGEAGGNDDAVFYSELWGAASLAAQKMWTETTLSPTKFGRSFRWVETYAGYRGESPILETLWDNGIKNGQKLDLGVEGLEVYRNGRLFALWNQTPRLSWQTPEYYAQEAATLTPMEFNRVHRNQWASSMDKFVPDEWWLACQKMIGPLDTKTPIVLAMDAGVSSDCFALVGVSGDSETYQVRYVRKWTPPIGGKIDFAEVEAEIRRLLSQYDVIEVAYDPFQLEDMAGRLKGDLVARVYAFNQAGERAVADKGLFDLIRDRRLAHNGDPDLTEHVQNANQKAEGESKLRIVKRSENMKIDLTVALSMALSRARYWSL